MQEDWLARWREGRTGFHEGHPNAMLERHHARIAGARRVLVPLCGKSEDLAYLAAHGHDVIGVELAESAIQAFFAEHALTPRVTPRGALTEYRAGVLTLFVGDVFALSPSLTGPLDGLYDRGALVALPPDVQGRYVALLRSLLLPGARGLVIGVEYDPQATSGPPWSVGDGALRALYAGATVDRVDEQPLSGTGKLERLGIPATESCYFVQLDGAI
jgi:thiopurine S-methyltransferase